MSLCIHVHALGGYPPGDLQERVTVLLLSEFGYICYQDTYPMYHACILHVSCMYLACILHVS